MSKAGSEGMGLQTQVLHEAGRLNETHAVTPPIWQTSTFAADSPEHIAELGESMRPAEFYTRYGNPSPRPVDASGMGAIFPAVMSLVQSGDHVVAQRVHYAGTTKLMRDMLPRWGVERTFVEQANAEEFAAAVRPNTKLIYVESPSNPLLQVTDLKAVAELARGRGITTVIDNTFATPVNQRPIELGIDVVVHSATKYLGGHHDLTAGVVVGPRSFIEGVWEFNIVSGSILSPFDAWLLLRGLKTLGLRVERQNRNALALAQFLESHPRVERVNYPGLESHPQHALARRQMRGFTGMMSVELKGGADAAARFVGSLKLVRCAVSLGGVETVVVPVAAMWSHPPTPEQRRALGIGDGLVRVSVGAEDERDLVADFAQALGAAGE